MNPFEQVNQATSGLRELEEYVEVCPFQSISRYVNAYRESHDPRCLEGLPQKVRGIVYLSFLIQALHTTTILPSWRANEETAGLLVPEGCPGTQGNGFVRYLQSLYQEIPVLSKIRQEPDPYEILPRRVVKEGARPVQLVEMYQLKLLPYSEKNKLVYLMTMMTLHYWVHKFGLDILTQSQFDPECRKLEQDMERAFRTLATNSAKEHREPMTGLTRSAFTWYFIGSALGGGLKTAVEMIYPLREVDPAELVAHAQTHEGVNVPFVRYLITQKDWETHWEDPQTLQRRLDEFVKVAKAPQTSIKREFEDRQVKEDPMFNRETGGCPALYTTLFKWMPIWIKDVKSLMGV